MNRFLLLFEVMDKEPSIFRIWIVFLFFGIAGFFLCRYRRWFLALVLPIVLFPAVLHLMELNDPFVGPDILREAGSAYFNQSYIAIAIAVLLPLFGVILKKDRS